MKERELQMIVSNSLSTLKDVAQLIRLFLYLHPITVTPSKKGFSMFMDFNDSSTRPTRRVSLQFKGDGHLDLNIERTSMHSGRFVITGAVHTHEVE